MIRPCLSDMINDYKAFKNLKVYLVNEVSFHKTQFGEWEIQLTITFNFVLSKDSDETRNVHTKGNNVKTDEIIEELLKPFLQRYQEGLEESMKGNKFNFDSVNLCITILKNKSEKNWIITYILQNGYKIEKATKSPKYNDDNCFQYALNLH